MQSWIESTEKASSSLFKDYGFERFFRIKNIIKNTEQAWQSKKKRLNEQKYRIQQLRALRISP